MYNVAKPEVYINTLNYRRKEIWINTLIYSIVHVVKDCINSVAL